MGKSARSQSRRRANPESDVRNRAQLLADTVNALRRAARAAFAYSKVMHKASAAARISEEQMALYKKLADKSKIRFEELKKP